ncbi:MAG TPA: phage terminase large subunit [Thermoguttaceae bacterium]|nr:phage terminase large subunit [Thermoguttaceae bacterium]
MPPRHGKSELISRYLPAWYLGCYPDRRVILTSHTASLAADFGGSARNLLDEWGPLHFGVSIDQNTHAKHRWRILGHDGAMLTAGVGGPITGSGADLLIIDDAIKNADQAISPVYRQKVWEWWLSTASTRLEPGGAVVVMFTRWHKDDLAGRLLAQAANRWHVISLPAIAGDNDPLGRRPGEPLWPERYDVEALEAIRLDQTPYWYGAMYQQVPSQYGEIAWPDEYFPDSIWATEAEWPARFLASAVAIDPSKGPDSKKGDFSAMVFVGVANHKLWIDARLKKIPSPQIVSDGIDWHCEKKPDLFAIETNQFQALFATEFRRQADARGIFSLRISPLENTINKELRIDRLSPYLARGMVKIRRNKGGLELFRELREFPQCDHDDGPDALEMACRVLDRGMAPGDGLGSNLLQATGSRI